MAERPLEECVPEAGSVLLTGPPMTGKYRLFVSLLSRYCERLGLISTHARAECIRGDFAEATPPMPASRIGVIDCVRRPDSAPVPADDLVASVSSPRNLTDIGVKFTELADRFRESPVDGRTGVGIHSVSQLLMFSSVETVYRFLRVLTKQIASNGWFGLAVLDDTTTDDEAVQTLKHLFDGVIRTRERDDGAREYRVRTPSCASAEWTPLPI